MSNVYAITHPDGYVKIGKSDTPMLRFNEIRMYSPYTLELFAILSTEGNALELEKEIHEELADECVHGEWFNLSKDAVYRLFTQVSESKDDVYHMERVNFKRDSKLKQSDTPDSGFAKASDL